MNCSRGRRMIFVLALAIFSGVPILAEVSDLGAGEAPADSNPTLINIAMYDSPPAPSLPEDVREVLGRQRAASEEHLRALLNRLTKYRSGAIK